MNSTGIPIGPPVLLSASQSPAYAFAHRATHLLRQPGVLGPDRARATVEGPKFAPSSATLLQVIRFVTGISAEAGIPAGSAGRFTRSGLAEP
jgi:hypothetical protein